MPKKYFPGQILAILLFGGLLFLIQAGVSQPMPAGFVTLPEKVAGLIDFLAACLYGSIAVGNLFDWRGLKGRKFTREYLGGEEFKQALAYKLTVFAWLLYLALYVTACLLCQRLHLGIFHTSRIYFVWLGPLISFCGLTALCASLPAYRLKRKLASQALGGADVKPPLVADPIGFSLLLLMTGTALAHLAWFPLTALPGIVVVRRWQAKAVEKSKSLNDFLTIDVAPGVADNGLSKSIEAAQEAGFGSAIEVKARFKIIPFIY